MIRLATVTAALLLGLAVFAAIAQTLQGSGGASLSTNIFTGQQIFPPGSSALPSIKFSNSTGGIYSRTADKINFGGGVGGDPSLMEINMSSGTQVELTNSAILGWGPGSAGSVSLDTAITRHATPGIIDIGTGALGNFSGGMQTGNATLVSLTTGTNADFLCLNSGGGILIQTTACTISSLRFKPDWKPYQDDALAKVVKLDVGTFHTETGPNADPNAKSLQAGLNAEDVARVAPECAVYENDMKTPKSYRQECVIALLVKAIQQLQK